MEEQECAEGGRGGGEAHRPWGRAEQRPAGPGLGHGEGKPERPAGESPFISCQEPMEEAFQHE